MKRSDINRYLVEAETFFAKYSFRLPPFAARQPEMWDFNGEDREIFDCGLGWDITDFGSGDFTHAGLLLFTLRNGVCGSATYSKPYAEKIMISREGQKTLMHCHLRKTEDIILRGGGRLAFRLFNRASDNSLADTPVEVHSDGRMMTVPPGKKIFLEPGQSLTLTPNLYHEFYAEPGCGDALIGEVSAVNDDYTDNVFYEPQQRFPGIEEDEAPRRLLVADYPAYKNTSNAL